MRVTNTGHQLTNMVHQHGAPTDLHDEKSVTLLTRGHNWPPWWKKCDVTHAGSQLTSMMKKVRCYLRGVTTDLHDEKSMTLLTWGHNWPFRCLDFNTPKSSVLLAMVKPGKDLAQLHEILLNWIKCCTYLSKTSRKLQHYAYFSLISVYLFGGTSLYPGVVAFSCLCIHTRDMYVGWPTAGTYCML